MADATNLNTMQIVSANNQPITDTDDASKIGTYGIIPMYQQIQATLRNLSLNLAWVDINGLTGSGWIGSLTPTFGSATSFTYQGDQTAFFTVGRRLRAFINSGTILGYVVSSVFAAGDTTVTAAWDSTQLDATVSNVQVSTLNPAQPSIPQQSVVTVDYATTTGGDAYVYASPATKVTALTNGIVIYAKFNAANTGTTPTINVDGLGAVAIKLVDTNTVVAGSISAHTVYALIYSVADSAWLLIATGINTQDIGGTLAFPKVIGLQGTALSSATPVTGNGLLFNGSIWIPASAFTTKAGDMLIAGGVLPATLNNGASATIATGTFTSPNIVGTTWRARCTCSIEWISTTNGLSQLGLSVTDTSTMFPSTLGNKFGAANACTQNVAPVTTFFSMISPATVGPNVSVTFTVTGNNAGSVQLTIPASSLQGQQAYIEWVRAS